MSDGLAMAPAPRPDNVPPELVIEWNVYDPPGARQIGPDLAWKELHKGPDIVWTPLNGGHWIVTRGDDIDFLQRNHDPFSMQDVNVPHGQKPLRLLPLEADPPEHTGFRAIISPWFTPKAIEALGPFTRDLAIRLVEDLRPRGECEFYKEFALQLPIAIFMKLTNVPASDKEMLLEWTEWSTRPSSLEQRVQSHHNMIGYIEKLIVDRRTNPGQDLMTDVVNGKIDGKPIAERDIISLMLVILFGGLDTVASSMSFIAHHLADHPELTRPLRDDPAIIPQAVDEFMRRFAVAMTARTLTRDYDYKGIHFKAGDKVYVPHLLYGLDDRKFERPLEVDFTRKSVIHAGFGAGPHRCPGSFLARIELKVFLEEWLKRIPEFRVKPGDKPTYAPGQVNCITRLPLAWDVEPSTPTTMGTRRASKEAATQ